MMKNMVVKVVFVKVVFVKVVFGKVVGIQKHIRSVMDRVVDRLRNFGMIVEKNLFVGLGNHFGASS